MSEVFIYVYDLTKGLASQLSESLLGKHISGIWHTGIVVYDQEIFFGSSGIEYCIPSGTVLGQPNDRLKLGNTKKSKQELDLHLSNLSQNIFHGSKYDLINHNCNTFSNELSIWLTGHSIPEHITNLPQEILNTSFGQMIRPMIDQYSPHVSKHYNSAAGFYNNLTNNIANLLPIFYKEALGSQVDTLLEEEISRSVFFDCMKIMVYSIKDQCSSYITQEIIDLIVLTENKDSMNADLKIAIFDVLRLFILRDIESVVILFIDPMVWIRAILHESKDETLNIFKCKFLCNLIGTHFDTISTNKEMLKMISNFGLKCMECNSTIETASSLIRNIVINVSELDEEILLEISSYLLHLLTNDEFTANEITKENVVGSVYYLVKHSELVKDLAKAQDIHNRIRRETIYCQLLHKELQ